MYLWRKRATAHWFAANQATLSSRARENLTIIEFPRHKRLCLEAACSSKRDAQALIRQFGGHVEKLSRNWLKRFSSQQKTRPLKIGNRLVISNAEGPLTRHRRSSHLCIPAGAAFGTGKHVTTAMSLRLLAEVIRLGGAHAPRVRANAPSRSRTSDLRCNSTSHRAQAGRLCYSTPSRTHTKFVPVIPSLRGTSHKRGGSRCMFYV
jgi:ribosomal protein L11 methylase PrmA